MTASIYYCSVSLFFSATMRSQKNKHREASCKEQAHSPGERRYEYATFERRLLALTLDLVIATIFTASLLQKISSSLYDQELIEALNIETEDLLHGKQDFSNLFALMFSAEHMKQHLLVWTIQLLILGSITLVFWLKYGATPGKALVGCRIVNATTYKSPTRKQFVIRLVSIVPLFIGLFMIYWDPKKRALHDMVAGTVVVRY